MLMLPLDTGLIQARLRQQVTELQEVGGGADYQAIKDLRSFRTPSVYVVLARERATSAMPGREGVPAQRRPSGAQQLEATVGVIIAARNYRDPAGETVSEEARETIGACRTALLTWEPPAGVMRPLHFLQGDVLDYDANTLLWIDVYQTNHFIGGVAR